MNYLDNKENKEEKKILIFGTGSFAELANFYIERDYKYKVIGFIVSDTYFDENKKNFNKKKIYPLSKVRANFDPKDVEIFVAVAYKGFNTIREEICNEIKRNGYKLFSYISPKTTIYNIDSIGENVFIFEDNTIQPFTTIGNGVILWSGNHIGHHTKIEDWVFIASHSVVSGIVLLANILFLSKFYYC